LGASARVGGIPGSRFTSRRTAAATVDFVRVFGHPTTSTGDAESDDATSNEGGSPMPLIANVVVALVALIHLYILALEMFLWNTPRGHRAFDITPDFAAASRTLAANQGLYNGFLAAGLLWGLALGAGGTGVKVFFLACVLVAGIFGALTASRKILWVQALPAAIGLVLVWLSRGQ
jgi:putative membrane protein